MDGVCFGHCQIASDVCPKNRFCVCGKSSVHEDGTYLHVIPELEICGVYLRLPCTLARCGPVTVTNR
jgi:hypothetical protein